MLVPLELGALNVYMPQRSQDVTSSSSSSGQPPLQLILHISFTYEMVLGAGIEPALTRLSGECLALYKGAP
jgi:hypothetical protein